jgi:hypothetical protein
VTFLGRILVTFDDLLRFKQFPRIIDRLAKFLFPSDRRSTSMERSDSTRRLIRTRAVTRKMVHRFIPCRLKRTLLNISNCVRKLCINQQAIKCISVIHKFRFNKSIILFIKSLRFKYTFIIFHSFPSFRNQSYVTVTFVTATVCYAILSNGYKLQITTRS